MSRALAAFFLVAFLLGCVSAGVVELNSESYPTITGDADKVVLVKVYAQWCGHCQSLAPAYVEVGEHFAANDKVVIAKFDAPENEDYARNTLHIQSFPTIFLYKNGEKMDYDGERTKEGLIAFVEQNL